MLKGSCLCGLITYSADTNPLFTAVCNCLSCQKSTGSSFSLIVGIKKDKFNLTGDTLKTYEDIGDSGKHTYRHFCSNCGSTLFAEMELFPDLTCIKAGTLEDSSSLKPQFHVYWKDHHKWIESIDQILKYEKTKEK